MAKKYDVILYGASGFTGKQTVRYFMENAPTNLKWAIAGRNAKKLTEVRDEISPKLKSIDIIEADSQDWIAIQKLIESTRLVLTTAGPYNLYGKNILASAAELGVDYVDITGETAFIRSMMDTHEDIAKKSGAKLIPFSGFDSVPSDLGVFIAVQHLKEKWNTTTDSIRGAFSMKGSFNGGTLLSMINILEFGDWIKMSDPAILIRSEIGGVRLSPDLHKATLDKTLNRWLAPFMMAIINTRVVNRSAVLFNDYGQPYGPQFSYSEHHNISDSWNPIPAYVMAKGFMLFQSLGKIGPFRELLRKLGPSASEGPSEESMNNGYYRIDVIAKGTNGKKVIAELSGTGDPGNRATVLFACESALALATQRDSLPGGKKRSGFLTPSTGLGNVLIARLKAKGVTIQVRDI